jgi:hypothetical protein
LSLSAADVTTIPLPDAPAESPTALPEAPALSAQPDISSDVAKETSTPEEVDIPTTNVPETTEQPENNVEEEKESHVLPLGSEDEHVQQHVRPASTFPVPLPGFAPVSNAELEDDQIPRY